MGDAPTAESEFSSATQRRFVRRVMIVVGVVGLIALALVIFGLAWTAMLTLFGGILIGVVLDGVAMRIASWTRMPRMLALVLVLLLGLGVAVGAGFWLGPAMVHQLEGLREQVTTAWEALRGWIEQRPWGPRVLEDISKVRLTSVISPRFGGLLSTTVGTLTSLVLVAVFGIYFALDPDLYLDGLVRLFPKPRRAGVRELCSSIGRALRSWFVGRLLSMTVIGVGTGIGLWIANVPLAAPLGFLAGLASFVPNLGPIMSAVPGVLVGLSISPQTALWALLVYVAVQILESWVITPVIEQRVVSLPPVLLLAFQMLMGLSAGVIGLFMATPLLVTIVVIVQALYVRDMLEDDVVLIGEPDH
ncbi:MAG TPA: AI-2E family transporter [Enhygromyxa sp.]|nr:AI-2E family transporter [Enhygromyxa sp.]